MNETKAPESTTLAPQESTATVVDIKRIVDALEGAGCEVIEVRTDYRLTLSLAGVEVPSGYLAVVVRPCRKRVPDCLPEDGRSARNGIRVTHATYPVTDERAGA